MNVQASSTADAFFRFLVSWPRAWQASRGFALLLFVLLLGCSPRCLRAQDSDSGNPTGPSGDYNGEVTTGGSYDPYTRNAKRVITDLVVPGSNGTYPLAFTRTYNSAYFPAANDVSYFGDGGNWRYSYEWSIAVYDTNIGGKTTGYIVSYPSGAAVVYRVAQSTDRPDDIYWRGPDGTKDRLDLNSNTPILRTSDGGLVIFGSNSHAASIVDPYGATTTLAYGLPGYPNVLSQVTEPGGRWLSFSYETYSYNAKDQNNRNINYKWNVLYKVQASTGQTVTYAYHLTAPNQDHSPADGGDGEFYETPYCVLDSASYDNELSVSGSKVTSSYTYTQTGSSDGDETIPTISTAYDPHYGGAMVNIKYQYADQELGLIQEEQNASTGERVSHVDFNSSNNSSTETRGDLASGGAAIQRTFFYGGLGPGEAGPINAKDGRLTSYTDFEGHTTYLYYYGSGQQGGSSQDLYSVQDARGNVTKYTHEQYVGNITQVTLPD